MTPTAQDRKNTPVFSGVLAYFPDAIREVAKVSKIGNDQHNPGEPLHWAKEKSKDEADACVRHLMDHLEEERDEDGCYHLAKAAWRALGNLQRFLDAKKRDGAMVDKVVDTMRDVISRNPHLAPGLRDRVDVLNENYEQEERERAEGRNLAHLPSVL